MHFGKELVATVTGTTYIDQGLKNGHDYYYQVVPMGAVDECFAVASACTNVTPAAGANVSILAAQATLQILGGDGDDFLDNCEVGRVTVRMSNIGNTTLTNLRIVNVTSPSHPATTFLTSFPSPVSPSLAACAEASTTFDFTATDLDPGEVVELEIEVTSDELGANSVFATAFFSGLEGDFQHFASKTYSFEADAEGWTTTAGTFQRDTAGGGANATTFYMESSSFLDNQCDVVQSPIVRLAADSTMTLFNNYNIETNQRSVVGPRQLRPPAGGLFHPDARHPVRRPALQRLRHRWNLRHGPPGWLGGGQRHLGLVDLDGGGPAVADLRRAAGPARSALRNGFVGQQLRLPLRRADPHQRGYPGARCAEQLLRLEHPLHRRLRHRRHDGLEHFRPLTAHSPQPVR